MNPEKRIWVNEGGIELEMVAFYHHLADGSIPNMKYEQLLLDTKKTLLQHLVTLESQGFCVLKFASGLQITQEDVASTTPLKWKQSTSAYLSDICAKYMNLDHLKPDDIVPLSLQLLYKTRDPRERWPLNIVKEYIEYYHSVHKTPVPEYAFGAIHEYLTNLDSIVTYTCTDLINTHKDHNDYLSFAQDLTKVREYVASILFDMETYARLPQKYISSMSTQAMRESMIRWHAARLYVTLGATLQLSLLSVENIRLFIQQQWWGQTLYIAAMVILNFLGQQYWREKKDKRLENAFMWAARLYILILSQLILQNNGINVASLLKYFLLELVDTVENVLE